MADRQTLKDIIAARRAALPHYVELDDVERDLLSRAIIVASEVAHDGRTVHLERSDIPALRALRERIRPGAHRTARPEDMGAGDGLGQ